MGRVLMFRDSVSVLVILAAGACSAEAPEAPILPALDYLVSADQAGPVAYRDPPGAMSPDGRWFAYVERERIHVMPAEGGAIQVMDTGLRSVRYVTWLPDSRRIAARGVTPAEGVQWRLFDGRTGASSPLWPDRSDDPRPSDLDQLVWSPDASRVAGVVRTAQGAAVAVLDAEGRLLEEVEVSGARLGSPAWSPDGSLACLAMASGVQTIRFPCGASEARFDDQEAYGGLAFSPDGGTVYYGVPGDHGFLDLWARTLDGGAPRRITAFTRDAYDPTVAADGSLAFRSQDYRTFVATAPAEGGASVPLTTFQSETPTWSWDGRQVALTYGSWRHVTDDIHYPDIAQDIGTVSASSATPHDQPETVVRASPSEDQGMVWSPNGRWIAFHTHVDSDDIWLMPSDGSGEARMLSRGGDETGWPRWSPDGRWIVFTSYRETEGGGTNAHLFLIGIDEESGTVTREQTRIELDDFEHEIIHAEWADGGETLVFEAVEAFGRKSLWRVSREGGRPVRFHEYGSDQIHSGIGVSPDGRWAAYVDRGPGGYLQIFRVPVGGGAPEQLTFDPTHKTQPAYAPTGERIAFTVFSYRSHFWRIRP